MYDRELDPRELNNLAEDPAHAAIRQDMLARLRGIVNLEAAEGAIRDYNVRRQATFKALASSACIRRETADRIRHYREALQEPWYDGGTYMAAERVKDAERLRRDESRLRR